MQMKAKAMNTDFHVVKKRTEHEEHARNDMNLIASRKINSSKRRSKNGDCNGNFSTVIQPLKTKDSKIDLRFSLRYIIRLQSLSIQETLRCI